MRIKSILLLMACFLLSGLTMQMIACPPPDCGDCCHWEGPVPGGSCQLNTGADCGDCAGCSGECESCNSCSCVDDDSLCTGECHDGCDGGDCVDDDSKCTGECHNGCSDGDCVDDDSKCSTCKECDDGDCVLKATSECDVDSDCLSGQKCDNCQCVCDASETTTTVSVSFPNINVYKSYFENLAKQAPMISDATFTVSGTVSKTEGEECCTTTGVPTDYTDWSGSINATISVSLAVPGLNWSFSSEFEGIYKVEAQIVLGPEVTVDASGSLGISGHEGECDDCVTVSGSLSIGLEVTFGGELSVDVYMFEGTWIEFQFGLSAEASLGANTTISGSADYNYGDDCSTEGWQGVTVCWGGIDLTGTLSFELTGVGSISLSLTYHLMDGDCYP